MELIKYWPFSLACRQACYRWLVLISTHTHGFVVSDRVSPDIVSQVCLNINLMKSRMHRPTLFLFCALQETENHPVPWASSSSSNNTKTWIVCMDSVSLPHHHNRDLHHLNYQTHLAELISTPPTVSVNTNGLFLWLCVAHGETQAYSHACSTVRSARPLASWMYACMDVPSLSWLVDKMTSLV